MSGGGLIICMVMLVLGIAWLALPYLRGVKTEHTPEGEILHERLTLAAAYEQALLTVRDLDEDFQVGKLSEEAYSGERTRWIEQGAALLEALEKIGGAPKKTKRAKSQPSAEPARAASIDDSVEQAIAAYVRARDKSQHN
jgi:hypothetical protein